MWRGYGGRERFDGIYIVLRLIHRAYKVMLSPFIGQGCRFHPTCSDYALEACERHGILRGGWIAVKRVLRCNPWNKGGEDPVPERYKNI